MSAINDALRRASRAAGTGAPASVLPAMPVPPPGAPAPVRPPPPPMPAAAPMELPPVIASVHAVPAALAPLPPVKKRSNLPLVIAVLMVCLGGAVVGYVVWQKKFHFLQVQAKEPVEVTDNDRIAALSGDEKAIKKVVSEDLGSNALPAALKATPLPAPEPPRHANPVPVKPAPAPAPPPVPHVPVRFPALRLQSIFYRPSNPSVIINGKTLFLTDEINGVTVADIQPASVTLVLSGQTNVLTLR